MNSVTAYARCIHDSISRCVPTSCPSGITPVYAVMVAVLKDPEDPTTMSLIFANQTEDDILLKAELDELCNNHPTRLKVWRLLRGLLPSGS